MENNTHPTKNTPKRTYLHAKESQLDQTERSMPGEEELYYLADFFKVFGDATRIKILYELANGEMCVNDIAHHLNMTQSSISHQLRILKQNRLVKFRRDGKIIFYSLDDHHVSSILRQGLEHVEE